MADENAESRVRSSSQLSGTSSSSSKKNSTVRGQPTKRPSSTSSANSQRRDPSLTSFPSLSPDDKGKKEPASKPNSIPAPPLRTTSQKVRERKSTLAGLTNTSPILTGRHSLFDDSPRSSLDIPGALHLVDDEHIQRLINKKGALKLVRQFATDLAQRDAELSALRIRADERERELKKMLRVVEVSSADIEKRLHELETASVGPGTSGAANAEELRKGISTIGGMVNEAMVESLSPQTLQDSSVAGSQTTDTLRRARNGDDKPTGLSVGSVREGKKVESHHGSRSNSISVGEGINTIVPIKQKPRNNSGTGKAALEDLFQPPSHSTSYFIGGQNRNLKTTKAGDDASVHSKKSSRSVSSWAKIFGGNTTVGKDGTTRPRSSSVDPLADHSSSAEEIAESARNALSRVHTNPTPASASKSSTSLSSNRTIRGSQPMRRTPSSGDASLHPDHAKRNTNLGPVEMDSIVPMEFKPPTMIHNYNQYNSTGLLTDRFGFIYDQRQNRNQKNKLRQHQRNKLSGVESLSSFHNDTGSDGDSIERRLSPQDEPGTPLSTDSGGLPRRWGDYLRPSTYNKSSDQPASPLIAPLGGSNGLPATSRARSTSLSKKSFATTSVVLEPSQATIAPTVTVPSETRPGEVSPQSNTSDKQPVKLLLDQLTDLHDNLQTEREVKWNDFLRKVRAERTITTTTNKGIPNAPEADLLNGEIIGLASIGRPGKENRAKYLQFKQLVLAGIPVSLRPKVWAECSGATILRNPGYFDELILQIEDGNNLDHDLMAQIKADITRTLTDNVFFRHGPGVDRLEQILQAYSLHNPKIGYCQGMNLIAGSMLLVLPDSESVFWLLVAVIDVILPSGFFDKNLVVSRADSIVLRSYVREVLPKLSEKLDELEVDLEPLVFNWPMSLFTCVVRSEPLFRVWDVILCLNSSDAVPSHTSQLPSMSGLGSTPAPTTQSTNSTPDSRASSVKSLPLSISLSQPASPPVETSAPSTSTSTSTDTEDPATHHDGTSSPFLFQLSLALLKLNEPNLLALENPAQVYSYINHNMTHHAISIDGLIHAAEKMKAWVRREDVLERRRGAVGEVKG